MNHTEYALTSGLANFFAWARNPVEMARDRFSTLKWKLRRWIWPPTLHQLRLEQAAIEAIGSLNRALQAGDYGVYDGNPIVPHDALKVEDLSIVLNDVRFRSCCLNLVKNGKPISHVHDVDPPAPPPTRGELLSRWFRGLFPVRVVINAWTWYE